VVCPSGQTRLDTARLSLRAGLDFPLRFDGNLRVDVVEEGRVFRSENRFCAVFRTAGSQRSVVLDILWIAQAGPRFYRAIVFVDYDIGHPDLFLETLSTLRNNPHSLSGLGIFRGYSKLFYMVSEQTRLIDQDKGCLFNPLFNNKEGPRFMIENPRLSWVRFLYACGRMTESIT
jgi:hypothetical protein